MQKDYAKYLAKPKTPPPKKRFMEIWPIISIICMIVIFIFVARMHKILPEFLKKEANAAWFIHIKTFFYPSQPKKILVTKEPSHSPPDIAFEFYSELSNDIVKSNFETQKNMSELKQSPTQAMSSTPPISKIGQRFTLQLGAFPNQTQANDLRISLLLAGVDAELIKKVQGNQTIYILQQGRYDNLSLAKTMQKKYQKKGINSEIIPLKVL